MLFQKSSPETINNLEAPKIILWIAFTSGMIES